jgi:ubiquinone biosynthesis protein
MSSSIDESDFAFLHPGPWEVDPASMPWRRGVEDLRRASRSRVSDLIHVGRAPIPRFAHVGAAIGLSVVPALVAGRMGNGTSEQKQGTVARSARRAFEHLGVTFIKLGQLVAGAEGMLPDEVVAAFATCRDRAPAEPYKHVRAVVEADLGRPISAVFREFDREPIAAASIAQVHGARLASGEEVVVKVQRPNLRRVVAADLSAMAWTVSAFERGDPDRRSLNLGAYVELFAETIGEELDFRLEAENMLDLAAVLAAVPGRPVVVPRPHPELVTERVLVMERFHGHKIDAAGDLARVGADPTAILTALLTTFFEGALIHGVFHGDMHGGNLLVTTDGQPALLDMGVTGRFTPEARPALVQLLLSPKGEVAAKLQAFQALGGFPPGTDLDHIEVLLAAEWTKREATAAASESDATAAEDTKDLLAELVRLGAKIPKELFLFVRGVLYLNGALAALGADIDLPTAFGGVLLHFADHHGAQLADEAGLDPEQLRRDAADGRRQMREDLGLGADVDRITFKDVKAARAEKARG